MRLPDGSYDSLPEEAKVFEQNRQDNVEKDPNSEQVKE